MTLLPSSPSAAALAQTTIRLVWLNLGAVLIYAVLYPLVGVGQDRNFSIIISLGFMVFLGLPSWRYVTWLQKVQQGAAREADRRRLTAWIGFFRVFSILGVVVFGGMLLYVIVTLVISSPLAVWLESPWFYLTSFLYGVASAGLLGRTRQWVNDVTADRKEAMPQRLILIRGTVPWLRFMQIVLLLLAVPMTGQQAPSSGHWLIFVAGVGTTLMTILILEFSLRFAWATAREDAPAQPQGQPLL